MANEKFNIFMISIRESKYLLTKRKYVSEETWISSKSFRVKNGKQNRGYHLKGHRKLCQKLVSKVTLHFV